MVPGTTDHPGAAASGLQPHGHEFDDFLFGIETEHLRLDASGCLSGVPHSSSLKPPHFTRDFAENQIEIVTEPYQDIRALLIRLEQLTSEARKTFGTEIFWPVSIPPDGIDSNDITLARFSDTEGIPDQNARRAELYRQGLALRYGLHRQLISGVHLNVSFGSRFLEAWNTAGNRGGSGDLYLSIARNLYRRLWLFILLTGATPVTADSGAPHVVSVRNSPSGYAGTEFRKYLDLSSLRAYAAALGKGLRTESAAWHAFGLVAGGGVRQLNTHVFQTEKEFYAPIRFRSNAAERQLSEIALGNVGRLELRFFDLDPFSEAGISERTVRLLHLFLLGAAFAPESPATGTFLSECFGKADAVASLPIEHLVSRNSDYARRLLDAAHEALASLSGFAAALDGRNGHSYADALDNAVSMLSNPEKLPSVRLSQGFSNSGLPFWNDHIRRLGRSLHTEGGVYEHHTAGL